MMMMMMMTTVLYKDKELFVYFYSVKMMSTHCLILFASVVLALYFSLGFPQEGWLSLTERASVSAYFGLPGYAPGTIAVNVTWMERGFNACQTHRSMYPSVFNRFPVIQPVSSKVRHFSSFFAHFGLPWVRPWDNCGKCYMDGKRIQCWSNACPHLSSTVYEL